MKILIASDSYKGSLSTHAMLAAAREATRRIREDIEVLGVPIADGGEGTLDAVLDVMSGEKIVCKVSDPLGRDIKANYGLIGDTAIVEMALSSGLTLLRIDERNPLDTSSYGLGEVIRCALENPAVEQLVIGIGGSATNDGGIGMAQALGLKAIDKDGNDLQPGGIHLQDLVRLETATLHPRVKEIPIRIMCDVTNSLCGESGASAVYGPQKGATPAMVRTLDDGLAHLASIIQRDIGMDVSGLPGAGAAGGVGAALVAFCGAKLEPGIEVMLDLAHFEHLIQDVDLVITGEGKTDVQTRFGKAVAGVAKRTRPFRIPVVCLSGTLGEGYRDLYELGVDAFFSICPGPVPERDAIANAYSYAVDALENIIRLCIRERKR